jgi:hypothetical protein
MNVPPEEGVKLVGVAAASPLPLLSVLVLVSALALVSALVFALEE